MKRYEALFILKTAGKDESVPELVDRIKDDLQKAGAKVSSVQKLDRKQFAYDSDGLNSGFYVNYVIESEPAVADALKVRFKLDEDVHRVLITYSPLRVKAAANA